MTSETAAKISRRLALPAVLAAAIAARFAVASRSDAHAQAHAHPEASAEPTDFAEAMQAAMARMHEAMQISPEGSPERDFARMMIAHHQGAIDMALALLRWSAERCAPGTLPGPIPRLAQAIVVEQRAEIDVMAQFLRDGVLRDGVLRDGVLRDGAG